ncbi:YpjP family protein [Planococcus sp. ISL-109]|uniref:YpjP family protein n=1 Tax=Planococcus sp. ISL-109 TaxID=2819166 RepID=UPI001BE9B74E|nr:YpjP family protein [Planococcus sp. ISL-109]
MKSWWQKSLMIAVTVLTLGAITPNHMIWESLLEEDDIPKSHASQGQTKEYTLEWIDPAEYYVTTDTILADFRSAAEEQSYVKFGSRIGPVIDAEFRTRILPAIQQVIDTELSVYGKENLCNLAISEKPSGDHAEKIFHVYHKASGKDEIRFHVRTEKKPLEGYSFNFHYHLASDQYQRHISIGDIYWSKDTPPKWLS